jgi:ABC-type lipoprotein export system ATPase subunit
MKRDGEAVVRVQKLVRTYRAGRRDVHALRGVDLTVARGEVVLLRGRSGSGKTTLLNCIGGLDRPTSGRVWVEGRDVGRLAEAERVQLRRQRIGFVFQSHALLPTYSAAENVDLVLRLAGFGRRARRERGRAVLGQVGLAQWLHHRPYELSGGQQQRVAIARAIAPRPALLLADEPTGELDTASGEEIWRLLRSLAQGEGDPAATMTVLIASHDPAAAAFADRVWHLRDGRVVAAA